MIIVNVNTIDIVDKTNCKDPDGNKDNNGAAADDDFNGVMM